MNVFKDIGGLNTPQCEGAPSEWHCEVLPAREHGHQQRKACYSTKRSLTELYSAQTLGNKPLYTVSSVGL